MEYIKVHANIEDGRTLSYIDERAPGALPVLIDKVQNGFVGIVITVEPGYVMIDVDISNLRGVSKTQEKIVEVGGTTPDSPQEVTIDVS